MPNTPPPPPPPAPPKAKSTRGRTRARNKSEEKDTQNAILLRFGALPWLRMWRMNVGKGYTLDAIKAALALLRAGKVAEAIQRLVRAPIVSYGVPGMADITGMFACGQRLEVEVKSSKGRLRAEQRTFQEVCTRFRVAHLVARSVEDVEAFLDDHLRSCSTCRPVASK